MMERAKAYIKKAATIILVCNCVVQLMQTFNWQFQPVAENAADTSILASISSPFAVLLIPLGFGTWQLAAAAITGFIAKENVVGTLAVVYSITNFIDTDELALTGGANEVALAMAPELGLTVLDEAMTSEPYAFAFQKGSELVAPFNEALDALLADGTVEQIFQQYGVTYIAP